jgi:hypothetical protein
MQNAGTSLKKVFWRIYVMTRVVASLSAGTIALWAYISISARESDPTACGPLPEPNETKRVVLAIEACMGDLGCPWSDQLRREYIQAVWQARKDYQEVPGLRERMRILEKGFPRYWRYAAKPADPCELEVFKAEFRWYVQDLMTRPLLYEEDKPQIASQCRGLLMHAKRSIEGQFTSLDPNLVDAAMARQMAECEAMIEAPMLPVLWRPLTAEEILSIKGNWDRSYDRRSAVWSIYNFTAVSDTETKGSANSAEYPQRRFTRHCMAMLVREIWNACTKAPDYIQVLRLQRQREIAEKERAALQVRLGERKLLGGRIYQLEQAEQWSFVFASLLSTCREEDSSGHRE